MLNILTPEQIEFAKKNEETLYKLRLSGYAQEETRLVKRINTLNVEIQQAEKRKGEIILYLSDHGELMERIEALEEREDLISRREEKVAAREVAAAAEGTRLKESAQALSVKWVEYHEAVSRLNGPIPIASSSLKK